MTEQQKREPGKPKLVHLANSTSQQVLWALEELGVEYDLKPVDRPTDALPQGLADTHVQGHSPQLILPSGEVLTQAPAINKYLFLTYDQEGRFHKLNPDAAYQIRELYLVNLLGTDLVRYMATKLLFMMLEVKSPFFVRPLIGAIKRKIFTVWLNHEVDNAVKVLESELEGRTWLLDTEEPSVPDILARYAVELGERNGMINLKANPNIEAFVARCDARRAWRMALEAGNGFDLDFVGRMTR